MKRLGFWTMAALLGTSACVPAAEDVAPRGAVGFSLTRSEATRGVSFATRDGYTVTIERLVVRLDISASEGGSNETFLLSLASPTVIYATAVPEGSSRVSLYYTSRYGGGLDGPADDGAARDILVGATAKESERFSKAPDVGSRSDEFSSLEPRPTVLLLVRAERGLKVVRINATFSASGGAFRGREGALAVRRNELTAVPLSVRAEALFSVGTEPVFESFAVADRNDDGVLDATELATGRPSAAERRDPGFEFPVADDGSLVDLLAARLQERLFRL